MRRHYVFFIAVAAYLLCAPLVSVVSGAMADMEAPFAETGTTIWSVIVPATTVFLIVFGAWLALRGMHGGIFLAVVGGLMLLYFVGALPEIAQDAGLQWPF
jgi:lysylphosphatidylglycerol synthetase-like protein (DUF2156 family)